ncbi:hypothetical protein VNO77_20821 [Canavalia gladiata]|uniref:Transmembrane protein n=1 Tax=Canavalia gladiata TaxID=3824 RepID=A0AAN9QLR7_CANGL
MAAPFESTTHWRATFYAQYQTFNLITPISIICNFGHESFTTHRHKIYAFTLPTLLGFLQVQSSGNTTSPFQLHPVTTKASVFGILGYYLAFRAWLCLPSYATQLSIAMAIFASFSLASLVSLLLCDSWWHIKLIFYVLLVVVELHQVFTIFCDKCVRRLILPLRSWHNNSVVRVLPLTSMDLTDYNA